MTNTPTYTVHRVNLDGSLSYKEHLNNRDELSTWVYEAGNRHANIRVTNDQSGEVRTFTNNGESFVWVR